MIFREYQKKRRGSPIAWGEIISTYDKLQKLTLQKGWKARTK